ncbi:hypothetical protein A1351_16345 [Methylosinus sp. R-45379]|nr:hypothetical protein A1351_16345 [Methylosinus sp. R-45379]
MAYPMSYRQLEEMMEERGVEVDHSTLLFDRFLVEKHREGPTRCPAQLIFKGSDMEIGVDSFAAIIPDPATGKIISAAKRMACLLDEAEIDDRVGLDVFGVGEHHREEFLDAALPALPPARRSPSAGGSPRRPCGRDAPDRRSRYGLRRRHRPGRQGRFLPRVRLHVHRDRP